MLPSLRLFTSVCLGQLKESSEKTLGVLCQACDGNQKTRKSFH